MLKSSIEHRETILVDFFILQYAKLRILELHYNFLDIFGDVNNFEELKMDTDLIYLGFLEEYLYDCIQPDKRAAWEKMREIDCRDFFKAVAKHNIFSRSCCSTHKEHAKQEPFFEESFRCTEMLCLHSKTYCCYDNNSDKFKFSSKALNKRLLEDSGDGTRAKYSRVFDYAVKVTSTNRGFGIVYHTVATYVQTKKGLRYFYSKRQAQYDGIHTNRLL